MLPLAVLCVLLCTLPHACHGRSLAQSITTDIDYIKGSDPKGAPVTIKPNTVWYWCGFKGSEKLTATVNATSEVAVYISARSAVKSATLASAGLPGYDTCKGTYCVRKASGKLINFNRCVAVGNFASKTDANATINVSSVRDTRITGIIVGIVAVCVGFILCCILSWVCCLKKTLCCCC